MRAQKTTKDYSASQRFSRLSQDAKTILEHFFWFGDHSRAQLAAATGYSLTKVNSLLNRLSSAGWLEQGEILESNGGRPSGSLRLTPRETYLLCVDLGARGAHVLLADTAMNVVARKDVPVNVLAGPNRVFLQITKALTSLLDAQKINRKRTLAIGVGIPGPVDRRQHTPVQLPLMASWEHFDLAVALTDEFGVPTFVDNDANVMALGELWSARRRFPRKGNERPEAENWLLAKLGTGIGAALVVQGKLYRGTSGGAGEIGHVCVDPAGPICRCGQRGCLEAVNGAAGITRVATDAAKEGASPFLSRVLRDKGTISTLDISHAAKEGDGYANAIIQEMGTKLGTALAGFIDFLNPQKLLIGGGLSNMDPRLLAGVRQGIYGRAMPLMTRDFVVERTSLGPDGGIFGAGVLAFTELLAHADPGPTTGRYGFRLDKGALYSPKNEKTTNGR
jgi:predicted NBD/HSP70 family sugar kinase